jgi:hypothetical protein
MVTDFVIQHISKKNFAKKRNPKARLWRNVPKRFVNADFDPRRSALPRVVVEAAHSRFVNLAFARSYFAHSVPPRKATLILKNHAIESDKIFLGDGLQKRSGDARSVKGCLVVSIGFDDTGLRIGHGKSLTACAHFRTWGSEERVGKEMGQAALFSGKTAAASAAAAWETRRILHPTQNIHGQ